MTDTIRHVMVRPGEYHDSVTLLRASQAAAEVAGVTAAQIAMATPLNRELAAGLGFDVPDASPNDLLVTVAAVDGAAVEGALAAMTTALRPRRAPDGTAAGPAPRSVRAACAAAPDASLVAISTPGHAALAPAMDAVAAGRHVFLFSDNVPLQHEIALKDAAARAGVLVMGPDCGTAIVGGVALGFANVLRAGVSDGSTGGPAVGVVAASGTGAQHLTCLLDDAGVRVSQVIGVGGRDLSGPVGGRATLAALDLLDRDPATDHIVLVSKPPDPRVADRIEAAVAGLETPVSTVLLGPGRPDITAGVEGVLAAVGATVPAWASWTAEAPAAPAPGALRGLFGGGTLADEAMLVVGDSAGPVRSNIPLRPGLALPAGAVVRGLPQLRGLGSVVLDLGDDAFTVGRPHPMIDPSMRLQLLAEQAGDADVSVVLLDVVLGHAADPDPAAAFAPAIRSAIDHAAAAGRSLHVVVSLCGTAEDPQDRELQAGALRAAGASVYASNAAAARAAAALAGGHPLASDPAVGVHGSTPPAAPAGAGDAARAPGAVEIDGNLLEPPPAVITVGVALFEDALRDQGVPVTVVDARPSAVIESDASGRLRTALDAVLLDERRLAANAEAAARMLAVRARLVDVRPAHEALGLQPGEFCHAGPPIGWARASGPLRGALIGALLFEGMAADEPAAVAMLEAGQGISLSPCHERHAVGPMAGVISPSMWLFELADEATGARSWCSLNEGLGKVLRYGAYGPEVIARLRWMADVLGPALALAVRATGGVDITAIVGQMLQMGDEGHNRNRAGTLMLLRELLPSLISSGLPADDLAEVARFVAGNDHFFLNLVMPAGKLMGDAAAGIAGSTIVTAMCRNGTDFGVRVSGTGDEWFTGPAQYPEGLFLPGFGPDDANPDIGDSAIAETVGHRRDVDGRRARHRAVRRRHGARRAGHDAADVRDHRGRKPGIRDPGARVPWRTHGNRRRPRTGLGGAAADQHGNGRARRRRRAGRRRARHAADGVLHRRDPRSGRSGRTGPAVTPRRAAGPMLDRRALNRALLARQLLLDRAEMPAEEAIGYLVGLQAQKPDHPHLALWSRLRGHTTGAVDALIDDRRAVRVAAMRSTIHLLTADDALRLRPVIQPVLDRELSGQKVFRSIDTVDMTAVAARGRELCLERPLTFRALGQALAGEFPTADPHALAIAVRNHVSLVQMPPRGRWRASGPLTHEPIEKYLGAPEVAGTTLADVIPRYLRAFGPASAADVGAWSGLQRIQPVLDGVADQLVTFTDERGRTLVDVPDGLLPTDADPPKVRLLPEYDNALLSHADRTRVVSDEMRRAAIALPNGAVDGSVLVDGFGVGIWSGRREPGAETVTFSTLRPLTARERRAVEREALAMLDFASPGDSHRVEFAT